ncbi:MAG: DUF4230 domain-containing protein [Terrimicrobiaceae bacterium]
MRSRVFFLTLLASAAATIAATAAFWIFLLNPIQQAVKTGNNIQQEFLKVLNLTPRIAANHAVLFAQNTPTLELVTVTRSSLARYRSEETWLQSTKTFEVEAPFTARAGFHLRDSFSVNIRRGGKIAEIRIPNAKILSLDMGDLRILRDEDGLWNKLTAKDREKAIRTLTRTARTDFLKTDILSVATGEMEKQIREIARGAGCEAVFLPEDSRPPG